MDIGVSETRSPSLRFTAARRHLIAHLIALSRVSAKNSGCRFPALSHVPMYANAPTLDPHYAHRVGRSVTIKMIAILVGTVSAAVESLRSDVRPGRRPFQWA